MTMTITGLTIYMKNKIEDIEEDTKKDIKEDIKAIIEDIKEDTKKDPAKRDTISANSQDISQINTL